MKSGNIKIKTWEIFKDQPILAGITTRLNGVSKNPYSSLNLASHTGDDSAAVNSNRILLTNLLKCNIEDYTFCNQVHGDSIHIVNYNNIGHNSTNSDALITKESNVLLNIYVADCVPIALFDPVNKVGAVCHCGWKGTHKKLLIKTINRMTSEYKSSVKDLLIGIGPSIGSCCYNVSESLYNDFAPSNSEGYIKNDKFYLDLKEINRNLAISAGVRICNIEVMNMCTSCNNDLFFSYRKEGESSGRFSCYLKITS